ANDGEKRQNVLTRGAAIEVGVGRTAGRPPAIGGRGIARSRSDSQPNASHMRWMTALADTCSYMRKAPRTREKINKHGPEVASGSLRLTTLASVRDASRRAEASPLIADCFVRRRPGAVQLMRKRATGRPGARSKRAAACSSSALAANPFIVG